MRLRIQTPALYSFAILTTLGFANALYLTVLRYKNAVAPCYVGSCEKVLSSSYSEILGVPVALLGVIFFFAILFCIALYIQSKQPFALLLALLATPIGFIASAYFLVLQVWVIKSFCQYCLFSGFIATCMFAIAGYVYRYSKRASSVI